MRILLKSELLRLVTIVCAFVLSTASAGAQENPRLALLVGNSDYSSFGYLANPVNDVDAMETSLKQVGFEVTKLKDATKSSFEQSVLQFTRDVRNAGPNTTALFFFAGHGVSFQNESYLLPVEASLSDRADIPLVSVPSDDVFEQIRLAGAEVVLIFLDACRDDPFKNLPTGNRSLASRGLSPPSRSVGAGGQGFFFAYATSPGDVAADGDDQNSPFTEALVANIEEPGISVVDMMSNVRRQVIAKTNGDQRPWDESSLLKPFYMRPGEQVNRDSVVLRELELEREAFMQIESSIDPADFVQFLSVFPDGPFSDLARKRKDELIENKSIETTVAAPGPQSSTGNYPISFRRQELSLIVTDVKVTTPFAAYIFVQDIIRSINDTPVTDIKNPEQFLLEQFNTTGQVVFQVQRGSALLQVKVRR